MTKERNEKLHKSKKEGIVINRMYVGNYLSDNLGHEVINLLKADNNRNYLYLNPYGNISKEASEFDYMLLVRHAGKDKVEIVGLAKGLTMFPCVTMAHKSLSDSEGEISKDFIKHHQYILEEDIKYDKIPIYKIFAKDKQQNIIVTCEADEVMIPKEEKRIFLQYAKKAISNEDLKDIETDDEIVLMLPGYNFSNQSLKTYIKPSSKNSEESRDYYKIKNKIIENSSLWDKEGVKKIDSEDLISLKPVSLFDICKIHNDENAISNALAYFMKKPEYRKLWQDFFINELNVPLSRNYNVKREYYINDGKKGRIDLLLEDDSNIVVIENKIKSDINSVKIGENESDQLKRYYEYITKHKVNQTPFFFILFPEYNKPHITEEMDKKYKKFTYKDIYDFLNREGIKEIVDKDANFRDFHNLLKRHTNPTPNGYLYDEMMSIFKTRLREDLSEQNASLT